MIAKWKRILPSACMLFMIQQTNAQYHKIDSLENLLHRSNDTVKANIENSIARAFISINADTAIEMASKSRELSRQLDFANGELNALRTLSDIYIRKGDLKNALSINKECVALAIALGDKAKIATAKGYLGMTYRYLNYDSKAFELLTEAVGLFREIGDIENQASFSVSIGNIYLNEKDYNSARKYYQIAIELSLQDPKLQHVVYINIGEIDQEEKKFQQSLVSLDRAHMYFEKEKQVMYVAYILYLKGRAYHHMKETDRAMSFYQRALGLYYELQNRGGQARCLIELGNIELEKKKYDLARDHFDRALLLAKEQKKYTQLVKIYLGLVEAHKAKGEFQESLNNQILAGVCKDSLRAFEQREKLAELQIRYENDIAEQEILQLKSERHDYYVIMGLLFLLVFAGTIISVLILRRHKTNIRVAESSKRELEVALEAKDTITKNLQTELEFKVKELTSFALNMIQKKEILETIKEGVQDIKSHTDGEPRAKLNKILSTINLSQRLDKDWENFKLYFEQVHQGFFDNLTTNYPELNANDIRLCALLRLNLNTKQIASVMDIAPESAKVAKHRLRKKLGLSNNDNLHLFFSNLGQTSAMRTSVIVAGNLL
jgi:tetratricopeptide (TPR) repeat protein